MPPRLLLEPTQTSSPSRWAPQVGQGRPVDALGGQHVDVVDLGDLLHRERLGRAEDHVPGVVDDDVQAPGIADGLLDRGVDRGLAGDVHLDRAQGDRVVRRVRVEVGDGGRVPAGGVAHARVDGVTGVGQRAGGHGAETAGGTGDDDGLRHDFLPEW